jgi:FMN phosphatase YigB (HAD superfamily)
MRVLLFDIDGTLITARRRAQALVEAMQDVFGTAREIRRRGKTDP